MLDLFQHLIPFFVCFRLFNTLLVLAVFFAPQPHFNDINGCKGLNDDGAGTTNCSLAKLFDISILLLVSILPPLRLFFPPLRCTRQGGGR